MEQYKQEYNELLTRYYNGCDYIKNHIDKADKYMDELLKILSRIYKIVDNHPEMTKEEISNGFK